MTLSHQSASLSLWILQKLIRARSCFRVIIGFLAGLRAINLKSIDRRLVAVLALISVPHHLASCAIRADEACGLRTTAAFRIQSSRGVVFRLRPQFLRADEVWTLIAFCTVHFEIFRWEATWRWEYPSEINMLTCPFWNWLKSRFYPLFSLKNVKFRYTIIKWKQLFWQLVQWKSV